MKKALCFPPSPNSQLIKPWKCSLQMAAPVLLLIYGNLFKVNCTFPLYPSEHVPELCLPWLGGCLDWGFCLIVSASRSMTFKSGEGKYCRGSKESVQSDCFGLRQLWVGAGRAALSVDLEVLTMPSHKEESAFLDLEGHILFEVFEVLIWLF